MVHDRAVSKLANVLFLASGLVAIVSASGCDRLKRATGGGAPNVEQALDLPHLVGGKISPAGGGVIVAKDAPGTPAIAFTPYAVARDTDVEVVPLKTALDAKRKMLAPGVHVRKKGSDVDGGADSPFDLDAPAIVRFTLDGDVGDNVSIVRYAKDGSSVPLATRRTKANGKTILSAEVMHFSGTAPGERAAGETETKDPTPGRWTIFVNGTAHVVRGTPAAQMGFENHLFISAIDNDDDDDGYGTFRGPAKIDVHGKGGHPIEKVLDLNVIPRGTAVGTAELATAGGGFAGAITAAGNSDLSVFGIGATGSGGGLIKIDHHDARQAPPSTVKVTIERLEDGVRLLAKIDGLGSFPGVLRKLGPPSKCDPSKLTENQRKILQPYKAGLDSVSARSYTDVTQAEMAAINGMRAACASSSAEFGARVCKQKDGTYKATLAGLAGCGTNFEGEVDSSSGGCPDADSYPVASVHCHPPIDQSDGPDQTDISSIDQFGLDRVTVINTGGAKGDRYTTVTRQTPPGTKPPPVKLPPSK